MHFKGFEGVFCKDLSGDEVKRVVKIADPNGQTIIQQVVYDWLPAYCKRCNVVGHNCENKVNMMPKIPQKQWVQKKDKVVQIQEVDEAGAKGDCDVEGSSLAVDPNLGGGPVIEVDPTH